MKKHLRINAAIVDMINTIPETIEAYDEVRINCALCLVSTKSKQLLSKGNININCANIVDIGDNDVEVLGINGGKITTAEFEAPKKTTVCVINGGLIIEDSPKKNLNQYSQVIINGAVLHPRGFDTSNFNVNGAFIPYPDGAKLILQGLDLDNNFVKAATPGTTYFVQGIPTNLDKFGSNPGKDLEQVLKKTGLRATEQLDLELLKKKQIRFYTGWVTTIEENAEELMQIVDGNIGSTIIPTGYKIMQGGELDQLAIRRFGKHIFVEGDLLIQKDKLDVLEQVEGLIVKGDVNVADESADLFFEKCSIYDGLNVFKGEWVDVIGTEFLINKVLLESMENGVSFNLLDSNAELCADVTVDLIKSKIHDIYLNGSALIIGLDQQNALNKILHNNNSNVNVREKMASEEAEVEPVNKDYVETRINCASYKL